MKRLALILPCIVFLGGCGSNDGPAAPSRTLLPITVDGVTLLAADPAPESVLQLGSCGAEHCLDFKFTFQRTAPARELAFLWVALLDANGDSCTANEVVQVDFPAGVPTTFQLRARPRFDASGEELPGTCSLSGASQPGRSRIVRVELHSTRQPAVAFDVPFEVVAPARSTSPTAPAVQGFSHSWEGLGDDELLPTCLVRDDDGEALSVDISLEDAACRARGRCWSTRVEVPARAFALDVAARGRARLFEPFETFSGELVCSVRDAGGRTARRAFPLCVSDRLEVVPCP